MFNVTNENLKGIRKAANYCLFMGLNGLFYSTVKEQAAADQHTIDSFNELTHADEPTGLHSGTEKERSKPSLWASLYFVLRAELEASKDPYSQAMTPELCWEWLSTSAERADRSHTPEQVKQLSEALEMPIDVIEQGLRAQRQANDNQRIALRQSILDQFMTFKDEGTMDDFHTLTAEERVAVMSKYVDGLESELQRFVKQGLVFRLKDGMGTVLMLKDAVKEGRPELNGLVKEAKAAA